MSIREISFELLLVAVLLGGITAVCMVANVATNTTMTAIIIGAASYILTLFGRDTNRQTDKHLV